MAHPNEDLVREGFAAFGRGDLDALQHQFLAEDIRYHFPGRSPIAGDYEGAAQVVQLFGRLFELSGGTVRIELHDVVANDEHAAAPKADRSAASPAAGTGSRASGRDTWLPGKTAAGDARRKVPPLASQALHERRE
jgi:ketosteroid isomerase-like protein